MISDWVWDFVQVGTAAAEDADGQSDRAERSQSEINQKSEFVNLKSRGTSPSLDDHHTGENGGGGDNGAHIEWLTEHDGAERDRNHRVYVRVK
jgi:hypothetical protein